MSCELLIQGLFSSVAIDISGGKRSLVKKIKKSHKKVQMNILMYIFFMALFKTVVWAIIFLTKLYFHIICRFVSYDIKAPFNIFVVFEQIIF